MSAGKGRKKKRIRQKLLKLVWLDVMILLLIAGAGVALSQRVYRQNMETETANVFEASFSNLENTLHFVENMAFNIINDKKVKEAITALNQDRDDRYALVDELYYRLISGSLTANDAVSMIVTDQKGRQYSTGSLSGNFTDEEWQEINMLLKGRSLVTEPIWFQRGDGLEAVYGREIYDAPFGGHEPLGLIFIRVNLDKLMAESRYGSLAKGNLVMLYRGNVVYSGNKRVFQQPELLREAAGRKRGEYLIKEGESGFAGVSYVGYEAYQEMMGSTNLMMIFFTSAILLILAASFAATARVVHGITEPIAFLCKKMKVVEEGDFSVRIKEGELLTDILEFEELAVSFNQMTGELKRLVRDNYLRAIKEKEYQLKALQAQINPHFLYNTLDAVNWLAMDSQRPEISIMVQSLAAIFREATNQRQYFISLKEELSLLACYVTIQKIRLDERLEVRIIVPKECLSMKIPKLSLQPILENSVKYGAESSLKPCLVEVRARKRKNRLILRIWDNGPGMPKSVLECLRAGIMGEGRLEEGGLSEEKRGKERMEEGGGIGLKNIGERVRMLGGEGSGLRIYTKKGLGTLITVTVSQPGGEGK